MKKVISSVLAISLLCAACFTKADIVVIVHPSSSVASLTKNDVSRLFLGKTKDFPGGGLAIPVNQDAKAAIRDTFNKKICRKNKSQYKAYWSQLVFTGKGTPPKDVGDGAAVKALVAENPSIVGYIDSSLVDESVKVVFTLP